MDRLLFIAIWKYYFRKDPTSRACFCIIWLKNSKTSKDYNDILQRHGNLFCVGNLSRIISKLYFPLQRRRLTWIQLSWNRTLHPKRQRRNFSLVVKNRLCQVITMISSFLHEYSRFTSAKLLYKAELFELCFLRCCG